MHLMKPLAYVSIRVLEGLDRKRAVELAAQP